MAEMKTIRTALDNDKWLVKYPAKELKKVKINAPDIYIIADGNNNWLSAGYTEKAEFVLSTCPHRGNVHHADTIWCVAFLLAQDSQVKALAALG